MKEFIVIENIENEVDEVASTNRAQIEHRATWMALFFDEMKNAGIDPEPIMRKAVYRCGVIHGTRIREKCANPADVREFEKTFLNKCGKDTFHMDPIAAKEDSLRISFNYCALLSAWKKLGMDDATCELLCDIAMDGDRGIAKAMGLTLGLTDTLAQGCKTCELNFHK
jgi:hypothetical protein